MKKEKADWAKARRRRKNNARAWTVRKEARYRRWFKRSWRWGDRLRGNRRVRMRYIMPLVLKKLAEKKKDNTE
jgi:hypothetical protein